MKTFNFRVKNKSIKNKGTNTLSKMVPQIKGRCINIKFFPRSSSFCKRPAQLELLRVICFMCGPVAVAAPFPPALTINHHQDTHRIGFNDRTPNETISGMPPLKFNIFHFVSDFFKKIRKSDDDDLRFFKMTGLILIEFHFCLH